LELEHDCVLLKISDRGCGMAPAAYDACGEDASLVGVGIASMRHRMRQAGGALEIQWSSHGTTVIAAVPVVSDAFRPAPRARGRARRDIATTLVGASTPPALVDR